MNLADQKSIPEAQNLKTANAGVFFLMMIALPFDNALFHFAEFLLFLMVALTLSKTGVSPLKRLFDDTRNVQKAILAIITLMMLSNFINGQGLEAWRNLFVFTFRYCLLLLAILFLLESRFLKLRYFLLVCVASLLIQFLPFLPEVWTGHIFANRFQGFSSNPNIIGLYAGFGILVGIYLAADGRLALAPRLLVSVLLILLSGSVLLASGNRGGWVALVGALVCFTIFQSRRNYKVTIPAVGLLSLGAVFVFLQFSVPRTRLDLLLNGYPALRDRVWENSYNLFLEKPIFGYGLDTKPSLLQNYVIYSEHNIFLSILVALGALGLLAYCFLLFTICCPALKQRNAVGLSAMTFLMGVGMFGFDFYNDQNFMICFIIVSTVCLSGARNYEDRLV